MQCMHVCDCVCVVWAQDLEMISSNRLVQWGTRHQAADISCSSSSSSNCAQRQTTSDIIVCVRWNERSKMTIYYAMRETHT